MATVWVKPHFPEEDGPLENGVSMNICSWANEHRLQEWFLCMDHNSKKSKVPLHNYIL